MFTWKKLGHIYNPCDDPNRPVWRWDYAQGVNTLLYNDRIRVYYCCREKPDALGQTVSRVAYADLDRNDPTKVIGVSEEPMFALGGLGMFDEFGAYPFSVVRAGDAVYGYYGGISRCVSVPFNAAIGCAVSKDDGNRFQRLFDGPVLSYTPDEPFIISSPKVRIYDGIWYMYYCSGREWTPGPQRPEIYYKLRMATSEDGIHWRKENRNILADKLAPTEAQACGDVIFANGRYHMFFCYRQHQDFRRNRSNTYRIGYAYSDDLYNWIRDDEKAGIDVSDDPAAWDYEMVCYPHVFAVDGRTYMLYLGNEVGKYGFGLAQLSGELQ